MDTKDSKGCFSKADGYQSIELILNELEGIETEKVDGFTIEEMADHTMHSDKWCREKMRILIKAGKAKCNGKAVRERMDGQRCLKPVYAMVQ